MLLSRSARTGLRRGSADRCQHISDPLAPPRHRHPARFANMGFPSRGHGFPRSHGPAEHVVTARGLTNDEDQAHQGPALAVRVRVAATTREPPRARQRPESVAGWPMANRLSEGQSVSSYAPDLLCRRWRGKGAREGGDLAGPVLPAPALAVSRGVVLGEQLAGLAGKLGVVGAPRRWVGRPRRRRGGWRRVFRPLAPRTFPSGPQAGDAVRRPAHERPSGAVIR